MILADETGAAVVAALGTVAAAAVALLGAWATLRAAKRMREESESVDQRKLDQSSFRAFTQRYDREREEQAAEVRRAKQEAERAMGALRQLWDHVVELRAVMREHDIVPPPAPRLPLFPWDPGDTGRRTNGDR